MAYTEDEVRSLVDAFLVTKVEVPRFDSGNRNVLAARDAVYDLLSSAFLLKPESFFALLSLGRNRLLSSLLAELAYVDAVIEAAEPLATPRAVFKVESTTDLVRAQAALLELNAGLNASTTVGSKLSSSTAIRRFRTSIESFARTELAKNVVSSSEIVETPDELRGRINTAWQAARALREDNRDGLLRYTGALADFENVRLPARTIQTLAGRIQTRLSEIEVTMRGSSAISQSREALLELLSMRALLTKASTFSAPTRIVFSGVVTRLDSEGTPPTLTAQNFGAPFMHADDRDFTITVDGGSPITITLPGDRRATVSTQVLNTFPLVLTGTEMALIANTSDSVVAPLVSDPADGTAAAALFNSFLPADVTAVWDISTEKIYFHGSERDDSYVEFLRDTADQRAFVDAVFGAERVSAVGTHSSIDELRAVVAPFAAGVTVTEGGQGDLGRFAGSLYGSLLFAVQSAFYATSAGDGTWVADGELSELGVRVGTALYALGQSTIVTAVDGATMTTEDALAAGLHIVVAGPDMRAIPEGSTVVLPGVPRVGGIYRTQSPVGVPYFTVVLDRVPDTVNETHFVMFDKRPVFSTRSQAQDGELELLDGTGGLPLIGFDDSAAHTEVTVVSTSTDPVAAGVRVGDRATFVDGASNTLVGTVTLVEPTRIGTTVKLPSEMFSPYASPWTLTVERPAHVSYDDSLAAIEAAGTEPSDTALDFIVNRLLQGARYTNEFQAALEEFRAYLLSVCAGLELLVAGRETGIDFILRTLAEQGMDRARDLLLDLEFTTFFSLPPDGVSYATNLVRKSAEATRALAQTPRGLKASEGVRGLMSKVRGHDPWAGS